MKSHDVLLALRLEDGRSWGDAADRVQWDDALAVLDPGDGPRRHWIGRPRGFSKTADTAGVLLSELVAGVIPPSNPAYAAASDRQQAGLLLDSLAGYVERSRLTDRVEVQAFRAVHKATGASVEILAADASGAYGLRPSRLVADELCQWPDTRQARRFFEALWTSLPKIPGSVGTIITTAGSPGHWSHAIYQRALVEPVQWRVSMTHEPPPWIDPALIEAERRALTDSAFARLWRNEWSQPDDALVSGDDLDAALRADDSPLPPAEGVSYVLTVDVGTVNDRTVVVVAHREGEGESTRVIVDRLWRWQGSRRHAVDLDAVEAQIVEAHARYPGPVILDPHQAVQIKQRLQKRGITARQFDFTTLSVGRIASSLLVALRSRRLSLPNDPVLVDELANVRVTENSAGTPRLDHRSGRHDDMAVAVGLACNALLEQRARRGPRMVAGGRIAPTPLPAGPPSYPRGRDPMIAAKPRSRFP